MEISIRLCSNLDEKDKNNLISKLKDAGFEFDPFKGKVTYRNIVQKKVTKFEDSSFGHVNIKGPLGKKYPPIAYIGKENNEYYLDRINWNVGFPKNYESNLKEICRSF